MFSLIPATMISLAGIARKASLPYDVDVAVEVLLGDLRVHIGAVVEDVRLTRRIIAHHCFL